MRSEHKSMRLIWGKITPDWGLLVFTEVELEEKFFSDPSLRHRRNNKDVSLGQEERRAWQLWEEKRKTASVVTMSAANGQKKILSISGEFFPTEKFSPCGDHRTKPEPFLSPPPFHAFSPLSSFCLCSKVWPASSILLSGPFLSLFCAGTTLHVERPAMSLFTLASLTDGRTIRDLPKQHREKKTAALQYKGWRGEQEEEELLLLLLLLLLFFFVFLVVVVIVKLFFGVIVFWNRGLLRLVQVLQQTFFGKRFGTWLRVLNKRTKTVWLIFKHSRITF